MTNNPTVVDARGMGGITAIDGFDYQLWDLLIRVPAWLANPAFEELVYEGLEDYEARFFAPQSPNGAVLDRFQSKASQLTPAGVKEVFEGFRVFETAYPHSARVQTLVMPSLPPTLNWIARDSDRVRKARPFYSPFPAIVEAGDAALRQSFADAFPDGLGDFAVQSVEVDERVLPNEGTAIHAFAMALEQTFPGMEVTHRRVKAAFEALVQLIHGAVGAPVGRVALQSAIEGGLRMELPLPALFPLRIRSDRTGQDERSFELDATAFSGTDGAFPSPDVWRADLVRPLQATSKWLRRNGVSRVGLSGMYRLTTAMVLGWSLRSAAGFELDIPTREAAWATDDRPEPGMLAQDIRFASPTRLVEDRLVVSIGVLRNPAPELPVLAGTPLEAILSIHLPEPIVTAKAAQAAASHIKRTVDKHIAALGAKRIDLYIAGPAAFAVVLGHRWNAMPPTQLHEFLGASRTYSPTAII